MKEKATFLASAAITIFLTGSILIAHVLSGDLKGLLVALTGHHWLTVSLLAVILFVLSTLLLAGSEGLRKALRAGNITLWSRALVAVTLIMMLGSLAVYIAHYLAG